jgi:hypothetical protein
MYVCVSVCVYSLTSRNAHKLQVFGSKLINKNVFGHKHEEIVGELTIGLLLNKKLSDI